VVATSSEDGTVKFWDIIEGKSSRAGTRTTAGCGPSPLPRMGTSSPATRPPGAPLGRGKASRQAIRAAHGHRDAGILRGRQDHRVGLERARPRLDARWEKGRELDSNPPTIAQRIDAANSRPRHPAVAAGEGAGCLHPGRRDLPTRASNWRYGLGALVYKKSALAAAQSRIPPCRARWPRPGERFKNGRRRRIALRGDGTIAWAATGKSVIEGVAAQRSRPGSSPRIAGRAAADALAGAIGLAVTQHQCASMAPGIAAQARSNLTAAVALKAAGSTLASMQAAGNKTGDEIKAATLDLLKWRAEAARLSTDAQYASRKADAKPAGN